MEKSELIMAKRKKRRRLKKSARRALVIIILLAALTAVILTAPYFNINSVRVSGFEKVTEEEILAKAQIVNGENIFRTDLGKARERVAQIPYINTVEIKRKFPDRVVISVTECVLKAYVVLENELAGIDGSGKVLCLEADNPEGIMTCSGLVVEEAAPGKKIKFEQNDVLDILISCIKAFEGEEVLSEIQSIDISNRVNIFFTTKDGLEVSLGDTDELNYKIKLFLNVYNDGYTSGIFDVSNPEQPTHRNNR